MTVTGTSEQVHKDVVEFVRLGQNVCLNYRVDLGNWATFEAAMHAAGGYNEFDPRKILASFRPLFDESMQIEFGRESSCVMYVTLPFWTHQTKAATSCGGERLTVEQRQELAARVITWARSVAADEISVAQFDRGTEDVWFAPGDNPYRIRIWWD